MTFIEATRDYLQEMNFRILFNHLGWNNPRNSEVSSGQVKGISYTLVEIAELGRVPIFEVMIADGKIPDAKLRRTIHQDISKTFRENLLIFLDEKRTQSLWYWVKRENGKEMIRDHLYVKGQPGDLSLGKLEAMTVDAGELDESDDANVVDVIQKLKNALDVERVTKRFFEDYKQEHDRLQQAIVGIEDEQDQRWYASVLINRLMFIYFLQRKKFLDQGQLDYLQQKLTVNTKKNEYYNRFLKTLFFEGFAKKDHSEEVNERIGHIRYLNGGLFLKHQIELKWPNIQIPNQVFKGLFDLFSHYTWNLDDTPGGNDNDISPYVLGYIFEKYINQKSAGAYYTPPQITEYLCESTISTFLLKRVSGLSPQPYKENYRFETLEELLLNMDAPLCRELLFHILPSLSLLDPACGSGAFLVTAMNILIKIYRAVIAQIHSLNDRKLKDWLEAIEEKHKNLNYYIKRKIVTENLFGVDIMDEAVEIAKLRLFLALVASVSNAEELEPLPNIDFNIMSGNSLIGLLRVNEITFDKKAQQLNLFYESYSDIVTKKQALIERYKAAPESGENAQALRHKIQSQRKDILYNLNELLLDHFTELRVKYEEATWNVEKNCDGPPKKRAVQIADVEALQPFHWSYEFSQVMMRGGFDIIITNPPWDTLKPYAKEFFAKHSNVISKNKMRIEDFKIEREVLLQDPETRDAWLKYQNLFPFQSTYLRRAPQYQNQISVVDGKKAGTDINLYKMFTEQCYNLLHLDGACGIVLPSGIYTDLGAKQLREMLFTHSEITGMFGFENRKGIFENVDSRFKFVVLTFAKGGETQQLPTAFMRLDVHELERFPRYGALHVSTDLIRRLSPKSFSMLEFKDEIDVSIIEKMQEHPPLELLLAGTWNLTLTREFDMTNDSKLFRIEPRLGRLPLYEGKMIHQFTHQLRPPKYWIDEKEARTALIRKGQEDTEQVLGYQHYRLAFREIARNTDRRTMIASLLPKNVFANHKLTLNSQKSTMPLSALLFCCAIFNSFTFDFQVRQRVTTTVSMFTIRQLPVPRSTEEDAFFRMIVRRAAQLICTTEEFRDLWESVYPDMVWSLENSCLGEAERIQRRAEIDGMVAHLYRLNETEFQRVLSSFPLVEQRVKDASLNAYHDFSPIKNDLRVTDLVDGGETRRVEFKVAACWNEATKRKDETMKENIVHAVAAFLNSKDGGTLLIGVDNKKRVVGLENDYKAVNPQKQDSDGYLLFLGDILRNGLVNDFCLFYEISFATYKQKEICLIDVKPAPEPVFVKGGDFYIRDVGGKRKLTAHHASDYQAHRWGWIGRKRTSA